ncbi:MAG: carboxypeptidase-like regulatory domain-containing protein, partial [Acidobacteriaceae bacterium]
MKSLYTLALVLLLIAAGGLLDAQVVNGINGTVMDTTGAVISGAHVSATNTATGVKAEAITSSAGTFTIVGLNPG